MLFLFLTFAAIAAPSETTFEFVGQPECVELSYADGQTQLDNNCEHALLIDQSVLAVPGGLVLPNTSTTLRDLSAFTLGMEGELYRAVATVAEPPEEVPAPPETEDTGV